MNIYSQFVFSDKLISPVNGYECKRITKQNIKQFGFKSCDELHTQFPNFPLMCERYHNCVKESSKKGGTTFAENNKASLYLRQEALKLEYNSNPKTCSRCNNIIPFDHRKSKYCSVNCGRRRKQTIITRSKISKAVNRFNELNPTFRREVSARNAKPKNEIWTTCYCCSVAIPVLAEKYQYRKFKLFSCDADVCKSVTRKKISTETGKRAASCRVKRSKLEIKLYELCEKHYRVSHNLPIIDGWDADIILEDHKIAVLWNGPWHYREMGHSNHSLDQVVTRDCIKVQVLEDHGWTVLIYQDNIWTPETALVDIINTIRNIK